MTTPDPKPIDVTTTASPEDREKAASLAVVQADVKIQIRDFLLSDASISRFASMMSTREARYYISSVLMAVAYSPKLQECSKDSILKCALRAASLEMSCDEGLHQGQLVPYKKVAKLIIHYLGIVNLAQRTGKFETINWGPIREGEIITYDKLSGIHKITGEPLNEDSPVQGYFAYFLQKNGYHKSAYMTLHEIHVHAQKWAPSYSYPDSAWNDPKKRPAMEQKTVIRALMKQADLSGKEKSAQQLAAAMSEDDFVPDEDPITVVATDTKEKVETSSGTPIAPEDSSYKPPFPASESTEVIPRPLTPTNLKTWLAVKTQAIGIYQHSPEQVGLMVAMMEYVFAPDPDAAKLRRSCIQFLFGFDSSKKMSGPQVKATLDWLHPTQDTGGAYAPNPMAAQELHAVWEAEQLVKGQIPLPLPDKGKKGK